MVEVADYSRILRQIMTEHAAIKSAVGDVEDELIIDENLGHFEIMRTGWLNGYRVHGSVIHVDIRDGKFWIQHDGTEYGVANELVDAGVPKDRIVLAFQPPRDAKIHRFCGHLGPFVRTRRGSDFQKKSLAALFSLRELLHLKTHD